MERLSHSIRSHTRPLVDAILRVTFRSRRLSDSAVRVLSSRPEAAWELFRRSAGSLGIREIVVPGALGDVHGLADDAVLIASYVEGRTWAAGVVAAIREELEAGGTFIDIGANIGLVTLPIAALSDVRCFAFEPEPMAYSLLRKNVAANCRAGSVLTFPQAVFDQAGSLTLEIASGNMGDHRVRMTTDDGRFGEHERATVAVGAVRLDDVPALASAARPIVVKIDTQGAETHVVRGGMSTLASASLVILEFWPYGIRRMNGDVLAIEELARHFTWACLLEGDRDEPPSWLPVPDVLASALELWQAGSADYWDLYLRK